MTEIPKRHIIVKRWTKDARDILPDHLHHYQRDQLNGTPLTFRHNRMYAQALELVRLRDASVEASKTLMGLFKHDMAVIAPFDKARDGLGLEDLPGKIKQAGGLQFRLTNGVPADDGVSGLSNPLTELGAPAKMRNACRPLNAKDKKPYEWMSKRSRSCSILKLKVISQRGAQKEGTFQNNQGRKVDAAIVVCQGIRRIHA